MTRGKGLVRLQSSTPALAAPGARLVSAFLAGRSARTQEAYGRDLEDFRRWSGATSAQEAAGGLLGHGHGPANETVLQYRAAMLERGLSPATVNRRLAAVRSLVKLARTLGMVPWSLEVPTVKGQAYRDTRGPGEDGYRRLVGELLQRIGAGDRKAVRDLAAVRLMFDRGLRRGEVVGLDVGHVDLEACRVSILGKGRTQREGLTINRPTRDALAAWIAERGPDPGPLFTSCDRAGKGDGRLSGLGVWQMVRALGAAVGLQVRPHGLRHAAVTAALDRTGGDVRAVQRFSRHARLDTLRLYDDNRADLGGEVSNLLADIA